MQTVVEVLKKTEGYFRARGISSPRLDAELIMSQVLNKSRIQLYMAFDQPLTERELGPMRKLVMRRGRREPMAWILGRRAFYNADFVVHPNVLVPRPDTEVLIEAALRRIPEDTPMMLVDVGCGTGCIGLTLAMERPQLQVTCIDLSPDAIACTQANIDQLSASSDLRDRVTLLQGNLLDALPSDLAVDVIVSNPPYIATAEIDTLEPEVSAFEPRLALDGGQDGLDIYRQLIPAATQRAQQAVLVEIGAGQEAEVSTIFREAGLHRITTSSDLGGHRRVVCGEIPD